MRGLALAHTCEFEGLTQAENTCFRTSQDSRFGCLTHALGGASPTHPEGQWIQDTRTAGTKAHAAEGQGKYILPGIPFAAARRIYQDTVKGVGQQIAICSAIHGGHNEIPRPCKCYGNQEPQLSILTCSLPQVQFPFNIV